MDSVCHLASLPPRTWTTWKASACRNRTACVNSKRLRTVSWKPSMLSTKVSQLWTNAANCALKLPSAATLLILRESAVWATTPPPPLHKSRNLTSSWTEVSLMNAEPATMSLWNANQATCTLSSTPTKFSTASFTLANDPTLALSMLPKQWPSTWSWTTPTQAVELSRKNPDVSLSTWCCNITTKSWPALISDLPFVAPSTLRTEAWRTGSTCRSTDKSNPWQASLPSCLHPMSPCVSLTDPVAILTLLRYVTNNVSVPTCFTLFFVSGHNTILLLHSHPNQEEREEEEEKNTRAY